jgi:modulator of FtsH protease
MARRTVAAYSGDAFGTVETIGTAGVFGEVMGFVAITVGFFTLGAYLGRDVTGVLSFVLFLAAFGCFIGLNFVRSQGIALTLLFAAGLLLGFGVGAVVHYYAETDPEAVWNAAGATALFVGVLGATGYSIRRDLGAFYKVLFIALLVLLLFGLLAVFLRIPNGDVIYAVAGLVIFGGYTVLDFNRLRRAGREEVVALAAGIFLDVINIFLFFLDLFARN